MLDYDNAVTREWNLQSSDNCDMSACVSVRVPVKILLPIWIFSIPSMKKRSEGAGPSKLLKAISINLRFKRLKPTGIDP